MRVKATGVFFIGECEIQTEQCTAKIPAPITAVKAEPSGAQINVCRQCLEEMVRDGQWEVSGSKIRHQVDLAAYDKNGRPLLVVEVKATRKIDASALRNRARQVRRNLLVHSGIPNSVYLMIVYYPAKAYLWVQSDAKPAEAQPDFEIDISADLAQYETSDYDALSDYERAEAITTTWLQHLIDMPAADVKSRDWLAKTGLYNSIKNERLIVHPTALAA